jgi:hypothetical protein
VAGDVAWTDMDGGCSLWRPQLNDLLDDWGGLSLVLLCRLRDCMSGLGDLLTMIEVRRVDVLPLEERAAAVL